ncbi:ATP-dependent RecD-like DNA helicase [Fibrobacter sp.]|uniref:ATP-dependent DNA helicase n=1 Tax=Fibrobacter sp. TaxID=35828 RepID=UPI0038630D61
MIQNVTVRVPWTDNNWNGSVCNNPCKNNDCLRLKNIYENRNEEQEELIRSKSMKGLEDQCPCISEGAAFMGNEELVTTIIHPYKKNGIKEYAHFRETEVKYPPHSLPGRPYRWMLKDEVNREINFEKYNVGYRQEYEPKFDNNFQSVWTQDARNHRAIFDCFYKNIIIGKSLCFAYAKQVPFINDDPRRIVIGIGHIKKIIPAVEHNHTNEGAMRSMAWETMLCHTIEDSCDDGFLMPYKRFMEYASSDASFDITKATIFAPVDYQAMFSFATEHLSHDGAIDTLLQAIAVFKYVQKFEELKGPWQKCINWCEIQIAEIWRDRGGYPGLGEMLYAFKLKRGVQIAEEIKNYITKNKMSLLKALDLALDLQRSFLSDSLKESLSDSVISAWRNLSSERRKLFELLCHFTLTEQQAKSLFDVDNRKSNKIFCSDSEIIENPYILYERTRECRSEYHIPVRTVDMAIFPDLSIQKEYPIAEPSCLRDGNDIRRARAILIDYLEKQSANGHSLYPVWLCVKHVNDSPIRPSCELNRDIVLGNQDFFEQEIRIVDILVKEDSDQEEKALQLKRLYEIDSLIELKVNKRIAGKKIQIDENWRALLDSCINSAVCDEQEEMARKEKTKILEVIAENRLSVLIGGAGTGKTTLLSALCKAKDVQKGGVLLLAPTGKARVKMTQTMQKQGLNDFPAKTIAQFLRPTGHYNFYTNIYRLTGKRVESIPETVIVDECSMLTEEMFGALLESLSGCKRLILVGDPNQLPPIGTGRPFVDLVHKLSENIPPNTYPRIGKNFGALTITCRQHGDELEERLDVELSKWFTNDENDLDDEVFSKLNEVGFSNNIVFKKWDTQEKLEKQLFETIAQEMNMNSIDDVFSFNKFMGAIADDYGNQYFNIGCAKNAEKWQILAPIKNMPYGVLNINHIVHHKYRAAYLDLSERPNFWERKIPYKMGAEGIVYGDKVICVRNEERDGKYNSPYPEGKGQKFVANGEIGIAMSIWPKKGDDTNKRKIKLSSLNVEYASQPGCTYGYTKKSVSEDSDPILELAYALTVHKCQGSEFDSVILILNEPCGLLSKELLYTALTRQVKKLIIFYNGEPYNLRKYAGAEHSDVARRFTSLFHVPSVICVDDHFYAKHLVHRTARGEFVRSKSEVIIADALFYNNIFYKYEEPYVKGGIKKIPDFTIEDEESGNTFYWEHCGMMENRKYKERWEKKKKWYADKGIVEGENLIVTYDKDGTINSEEIRKIIEKYFL